MLNLGVVWTSEFAANKWILPLPADAIPTGTMIPATVNAATYRDSLPTAEYWREFHANDGEFYGHVLGFKGLERSVVVLRVNGFKDLGRAAEQLYVGLARARSLSATLT